MKTSGIARGLLVGLATVAFGLGAITAYPQATVPAHMVVTVEAHHGDEVPVLSRQDVTVKVNKEPAQVTDWVPLQGERAGLELFLLIDDATTASSIGPQLEDLRRFIAAQPPTTAIGVAYMENGTARVLQNLTNDHALAAKALRLPFGSPGAVASPYFAVEDLIKRWPESRERHEVLMVTDGIDRFGGVGPANPYVDSTISVAQRAGVIIYAIYATGVGHFGHTFFRVFWGQNYLSQVADETGGEAYFLGTETPVSFTPYLQDVQRRLNRQYLLAFLAKPGKKAELQPVKVKTEVPNAEIVAAPRVWVPAP